PLYRIGSFYGDVFRTPPRTRTQRWRHPPGVINSCLNLGTEWVAETPAARLTPEPLPSFDWMRPPIICRRFGAATAGVHAAPSATLVLCCVVKIDDAVRIFAAPHKRHIAVFEQPCGGICERNKQVTRGFGKGVQPRHNLVTLEFQLPVRRT